MQHFDFDWIIIGSGFGGSICALRLAEKGYSVCVLECGKRFRDEDFAQTTWQLNRFLWIPKLGLKGILRLTPFKDIFVANGSGVGGGSLVYANTLYRAKSEFFHNPQWRELCDWEKLLRPYYQLAEHMLGVQIVPFDSPGQQLMRKVAAHYHVENTFSRTPCAVFFGQEGKTVPDPYFNGEGPARTGCTRCGACMVGCRVGAKNTLVKNYLWFAEKKGVTIKAEHQVVDVKPIGAVNGSDGYRVTTEQSGSWFFKERKTFNTRGVIFAAGALGTNQLLIDLKYRKSLPKISDHLGKLVRTNSESILCVKLPNDQKTWNDIAISSSIYIDTDTHIEFVTYGKHGDFISFLSTILVGQGTRLTRPLLWLFSIIKNPQRWLMTLSPFGWSRRVVIFLVMQALDNAITLKPKKRWLSRGYNVKTEQDSEKPNPTFITAGNAAAKWLANETGGIAQSSTLEALANIPTTAHLLGGAVIGADKNNGVVDQNLHVFGYQNMLVCDGSVMPANPGVNPSLTICALSEYATAQIPEKSSLTYQKIPL